MANIATLSRTRMMSALASVRSRLANIREAAEEAGERTIVVVAAPIGGGAAGWYAGRAQRDGKKITIGDSTIRWTVPIAMGTAALGAFFPRLVGKFAANGMLGLGAGGLGWEAGDWGFKQGLKPST